MSTILSNQPITTTTGVSQFAPPPYFIKQFTSWGVIRVVVGALLLISAVLKLQLLLTSTNIVSSDWMASPRVQWLAVGWESALAFWLWSGWNANASRRVALATFSVFAAVSFHQAAAGKRTCCCFGAFQAQPWLVFVLDLGIVAWLYRARRITNKMGAAATPLLRNVLVTLATLSFTVALSAAAWYQSPTSVLQVLDWPDRTLTVAQGSQTNVSFRIVNLVDSPVSVAYFSSSCECLTIGTSSRTIAPRGTCDALAIIDLGKRPGFEGELAITARAISANSRRPLMEINLQLKVGSQTSEAIR